MILKCTCVHSDQDQMYGADMRLHNQAKQQSTKAGGLAYWRCTVCGVSNKQLKEAKASK